MDDLARPIIQKELGIVPPPPSEPSVISVARHLVQRKTNDSRKPWRADFRPVLDAQGRKTALWDGPAPLRPKKSSLHAEGKYRSLVSRLEGSWRRDPDTIVRVGGGFTKENGLPEGELPEAVVSQMAFLLWAAEVKKHGAPAEKRSVGSSLGARPWRTKDHRDLCAQWEAEEDFVRAEHQQKAHEICVTIIGLMHAERALKRIKSAQAEVKQALDRNRPASQTTEDDERAGGVLVAGAATTLQSFWRGSKTRHRLDELAALELGDMADPLTFDVKQAARQRAAEKLVSEAGAAAPSLYTTAAGVGVLAPGIEAARLAAAPSMGPLQSAMGVAFEFYVSQLWGALCTARANLVRESSNAHDFVAVLRTLPTYGDDERVGLPDLRDALTLHCPSLSKQQLNLLLVYFDTRCDGFVDTVAIGNAIRGSLSERRLALCNFAFDHLCSSGNTSSQTPPSRLELLREFYAQFAPEESNGKPDEVDAKFPNTEAMNKKIFSRLYKKYARHIAEVPAHLWNEDERRRRAEGNRLLDSADVLRRYASVASDFAPSVARIVEAAKRTYRENSCFSRTDWVTFHAELSSTIEDPAIFESVVLTACCIDSNVWIAHSEEAARTENSTTTAASIAEAEAEKMAALRQAVSLDNFEAYERDLNDTLRKIRASLVSAGGATKTLEGLGSELANAPTYGDDHKASLARYGVVLTRGELKVLTLHYDNNSSGYVSVDGFVFGVRASEARRQSVMRTASESRSSDQAARQLRRWVKAVRASIVPESEKRWLEYANGEGRPYWFCELTGERTWKKPAAVVKAERATIRKSINKEQSWAQRKLEAQAKLARDEVRQHIASLSYSALPLMAIGLVAMPTSLDQLRRVYVLSLSRNALSVVPDAVTKIHSLMHLDLSDNGIKVVPTEIKALKNLVTLGLARNELKKLPAEISKLTELRELDLEGNMLLSLPPEIAELVRLEVLSASNNRINSLPGEATFDGLRALRWLLLSGNQLDELPEAIASLDSLVALELHDNRLRAIPEDIGNLQDLTMLTAHGNELERIPESIGDLAVLSKLTLQHNKLTTLPGSLCALESLVFLSLNNNLLISLPEDFGALKSLQDLKAQGNQLTELPETFGGLESLSVCWLHQNHLSLLPASLPPSLQQLKLHSNALTTLPRGIGLLTKLEMLDLGSNRITTLPPSMGHLGSLDYLRLDGNSRLTHKLAKVVREGSFQTYDELNYGLLLRKLVDGLKGFDVHAKINISMGVTIADAVAQAESRRKAVIKNGSQDLTEQILNSCFARFVPVTDTGSTLISAEDFHECIRVIGCLLTKSEMGRLTDRAFEIHDPEHRGSLPYDMFVRSTRSRSAHSDGRYADVAHAVVRFCASLLTSTGRPMHADTVGQQNEHMKGELDKLRTLRSKLDEETKDITRKLNDTKHKAKIVQAVRKSQPQKSSGRPEEDSQKQRDAGIIDTEDETAWSTLMTNEELKRSKRRLRGALRQKTREMDRLRGELDRVSDLARGYSEGLESQWNREQRERRMRQRSKRTKTKGGPAPRTVARERLREIFNANASETTHLLSKGAMITAIAEIFRELDSGRQGDAKQWRQRILQTVQEAFASGYVDTDGKFVAFDRDEDGALDFEDFVVFCSVIEKRLIGDAPEDEEDENPVPPARTRGGDSFVLVDMLSTPRNPIQIAIKMTETIAELKQKIEFQESILSSLQILVCKGKRLNESETLLSAGIRSGAVIKLIVADRTISGR